VPTAFDARSRANRTPGHDALVVRHVDRHRSPIGSTSDVIISRGLIVYPAEIDAVLLTHPAVADVATVGVPNPEWGEEVKSVVELRDGFEPTTDLAAELEAYCRQRLAAFKCPRSIDFTKQLPRFETGKDFTEGRQGEVLDGEGEEDLRKKLRIFVAPERAKM